MEVEIWFDVVCKTESRYEIMFTLFADHEMSIRPNINETLNFHQIKGSSFEFKQSSPIGPARQSIVSVTVEEVSHYLINEEGNIRYKTAIRCSEFPVISEDDAQIVCNIMTTQCGFEVDPYGINKLK